MNYVKIVIFAVIALGLCSLGGGQFVMSKVPLNQIKSVQYSAFSGVPFPNCVETLNDTTVILHFIGSCSGEFSYQNLRYYTDLGYQVQDAKLIALGNMEATLVKTGYITTFHENLKTMTEKLGICDQIARSGISC